MNTRGIVIFSLVLFAVIAGFVMKNRYNAYQKQKLVDAASSSEEATKSCEIIYFYTTWCPYCKKARPAWDEFKSEWSGKNINGYMITFPEVDCDINETKANKYDVKSYPTIKLIKDGQTYDFDARPTEDSLTQFIVTIVK